MESDCYHDVGTYTSLIGDQLITPGSPRRDMNMTGSDVCVWTVQWTKYNNIRFGYLSYLIVRPPPYPDISDPSRFQCLVRRPWPATVRGVPFRFLHSQFSLVYSVSVHNGHIKRPESKINIPPDGRKILMPVSLHIKSKLCFP